MRKQTQKLHSLLSAFDKLTGCPVLVNTSFYVSGERIENTPEDAYRSFMNTEMDYFVIENHLLSKVEQPDWDNNDEYVLV